MYSLLENVNRTLVSEIASLRIPSTNYHLFGNREEGLNKVFHSINSCVETECLIARKIDYSNLFKKSFLKSKVMLHDINMLRADELSTKIEQKLRRPAPQGYLEVMTQPEDLNFIKSLVRWIKDEGIFTPDEVNDTVSDYRGQVIRLHQNGLFTIAIRLDQDPKVPKAVVVTAYKEMNGRHRPVMPEGKSRHPVF